MKDLFAYHLDEPFFWFCALAGSGLFIIQLTLSFLGAHHDSDLSHESAEIEVSKLKWMSKHALTGFLLMFGWTGLTCRKEFGLSFAVSALSAGMAGTATMFLIGWIFKLTQKLRSTGTVFNIEDAVGKEATVYQRIPQGGMGKVSLSMHDFTHELDAISNAQEDLPSFISVHIIQKLNDTTVVVVPKR